MKRNVKAIALILIMMLCFAMPALAADIAIEINGVVVNSPVAPVQEKGTTLVPIRVISENLGAKVDFDPATQGITITQGEKVLGLNIGKTEVSANGVKSNLTLAPRAVNGTTLVPIRFVSENLDCSVEWQAAKNTVAITKEGVTPKPAPAGKMKVSFIDVGQADSALIQTPNGKNIVIDAGNNDDGTLVVNYLKNNGVKTVDVAIATHPHEDHIGGMDTVINSFDVNQVWMPKATHTTKTYEDVLNAVKNKGLKIDAAKAGVSFIIDGVKFEMFGPVSSTYEDLNNYSPIIKVSYGSNSFLFTGDAEKLAEDEVLAKKYDVKADVLKVAHHGSTTSTSPAFAKAVAPKYSIISVGKENKYGHPDNIIINRLQMYGKVYRTDLDGTIVATADGKNIAFNKVPSQVNTGAAVNPKPDTKPSASQVFVTKTGTKYHRDGCSSLSSSKIAISVEDAKAKYGPCSKCNP